MRPGILYKHAKQGVRRWGGIRAYLSNQGRAHPPPQAQEGGPSLQGDISRDLSPNDLIAVSTKLILSLSPEKIPQRCGTAAVQSSSHMTIGFVAKRASELKLHRMTPAPLLLFACVQHVDRLQLDSAPAEVELCAAAHGQS